jgi:hypothetical protein
MTVDKFKILVSGFTFYVSGQAEGRPYASW